MKLNRLALVLTVAAAGLFPASAQPQQYVISTLGGGQRSTLSTPARGTDLWVGPVSYLALDPAGNLYFSYASAVFKLDSTGIVTHFAGGSGDIPGDGAPAANARLIPGALAANVTGNLFIVDTSNYRTRRVASSGIIATVAGNGMQGSSGDGGPAVNAQFRFPGAVAVDASGNLFLVDGNSVRKISSTGIITTVAGNGTAGFSGDGGPAVNAELNWPTGLAVDSAGNLYIADSNSYRVRRVSPDGIISTVAGSGEWGFCGYGRPATSAQVLSFALAVDGSGNLYIADCDCTWDGTGNSRVRKVSADGIITSVAGTGDAGFSGDGGPAISAQLNGADALAVDTAGNLYIGDYGNFRIRKVSPSGTISTVAGGAPYPAASNPSGGAAGVTLDSADNLLIVDSTAVNKITADGTIQTVASVGGNALAADKSGNLYVTGLAIDKVSPGGCVSRVSAPGTFGTPGTGGYGIAVDGAGDLFVGSGYVLSRISPAGAVTTVAGGGKDIPGDGGLAVNAVLNNVTGVVLDGAGNLFFSETYGNRVRKMTPDGILTTIAGTGDVGYSGDGGPAASAQLNGPVGLALDPALDPTFGGTVVQSAAEAPGQIAGPMQVTVQIPGGVHPGGYVPVVLQVGDASTPPDAAWIAVSGN